MRQLDYSDNGNIQPRRPLATMAIMPRRPKDGPPQTRVGEIRQVRGLTLTQVAKKAGVGAPTIQKLEKPGGTKGITRNMAAVLVKALNVPVGELYEAMGSPISDSPISDAVPLVEDLGDISDKPEDQAFFRQWVRLDEDVQVAILTITKAILRIQPKRRIKPPSRKAD